MPALPSIHSQWRHHNGNVYQVVCIANRLTTRPEKYPVTVVYMGVTNGHIWSRPLSRWYESMTEIESND